MMLGPQQLHGTRKGATVNGGNGKWKRNVETENGNGKRKRERVVTAIRTMSQYKLVVVRHARPG